MSEGTLGVFVALFGTLFIGLLTVWATIIAGEENKQKSKVPKWMVPTIIIFFILLVCFGIQLFVKSMIPQTIVSAPTISLPTDVSSAAPESTKLIPTNAFPSTVPAILVTSISITPSAIPPPPPSPTSSSQPESALSTAQALNEDIISIRNTIDTELQGVLAKNIFLVETAFDKGALIIDKNHTPRNANDDTIYSGWDEIKQRYIAIFSENWKSIKLTEIHIEVSGDTATLTHSGPIIDGEYVSDFVIYTLIKKQGKWLITRQEYNMR